MVVTANVALTTFYLGLGLALPKYLDDFLSNGKPENKTPFWQDYHSGLSSLISRAYPSDSFPNYQEMPRKRKQKSTTPAKKKLATKPRARKPRARKPPRQVMKNRTTQPDAAPASVYGAPAAVGVNFGPALLPFVGAEPQKDTDMTSPGTWSTQTGVRVYGSDMFTYNLRTEVVTSGSWQLLFNSTADPDYNVYVPFTPSTVSSRLSLQESLYQYYAWRELVIEFIPLITPSGGGIAANLLSVGLLTDYDAIMALSNTSTLFSQVNSLVPSVAFTAWENAKLVYRFAGKRLWETDTLIGGDAEGWTQLTMVAANRAAGVVGATDLSAIRVTYVIDFYMPSFVGLTPALSAKFGWTILNKALGDMLRTRGRSEIKQHLAVVKTYFAPHRLKRHPEGKVTVALQDLSENICKYLDWYVTSIYAADEPVIVRSASLPQAVEGLSSSSSSTSSLVSTRSSSRPRG